MFNFDISNKQLFAQNSVLANEIMTIFEKKTLLQETGSLQTSTNYSYCSTN